MKKGAQFLPLPPLRLFLSPLLLEFHLAFISPHFFFISAFLASISAWTSAGTPAFIQAIARFLACSFMYFLHIFPFCMFMKVPISMGVTFMSKSASALENCMNIFLVAIMPISFLAFFFIFCILSFQLLLLLPPLFPPL